MLASAVQIAGKYWPMFWAGIKITLLISLTGTIIGLVIGLIVGSARSISSKIEPRDSFATKIVKRIVNVIACVYIEFFRGTPMMVQAVFLYYGLKSVFNWTPVVAGICIISINTGAYMAEILRSGGRCWTDRGRAQHRYDLRADDAACRFAAGHQERFPRHWKRICRQH